MKTLWGNILCRWGRHFGFGPDEIAFGPKHIFGPKQNWPSSSNEGFILRAVFLLVQGDLQGSVNVSKEPIKGTFHLCGSQKCVWAQRLFQPKHPGHPGPNPKCQPQRHKIFPLIVSSKKWSYFCPAVDSFQDINVLGLEAKDGLKSKNNYFTNNPIVQLNCGLIFV